MDNTFKKQQNYYAYARAEMMKFIPQDSKKILDIGCGQGEFGKQLKQKLQAEVWGIEINGEAASKAGVSLDKIFTGDVTVLVKDLPNNYFDCVVLNDVLEHLVDPYSVLANLKSKLSPEGVIVASIPNVRFFHNLKNLILKKDWRYTDEGILDRTHLRFFTKKSITEMFENLGFQIRIIEGINPILDWKFKVVNFLTLGFFSDTRYLEFACVANAKK